MRKQIQRPYTESDLEYLCRFHEHDGYRTVAAALERDPGNVNRKLQELKAKGLYHHYKNLNKHWV